MSKTYKYAVLGEFCVGVSQILDTLCIKTFSHSVYQGLYVIVSSHAVYQVLYVIVSSHYVYQGFYIIVSSHHVYQLRGLAIVQGLNGIVSSHSVCIKGLMSQYIVALCIKGCKSQSLVTSCSKVFCHSPYLPCVAMAFCHSLTRCSKGFVSQSPYLVTQFGNVSRCRSDHSVWSLCLTMYHSVAVTIVSSCSVQQDFEHQTLIVKQRFV